MISIFFIELVNWVGMIYIINVKKTSLVGTIYLPK